MKVSILFLISVTLVSSSLYLLPLAYPQELSYVLNWSEGGEDGLRIRSPAGIAIDPSSGNVYVADTANHRIQVFYGNGTFISEWGGYGVNDGSFNNPSAIAIDPSFGNVYVADTGNNRIQVFYGNGTFISQWGKYDTLRSPAGIAIDPSSGNVYVADTANHRIQVFSSNGTFITKWGQYGSSSRNGTLTSPSGIAVNQSSGNVYVADTGNNRIQVFSSNGTFISEWGGYGQGKSRMRFPSGIAIDPSSGNVYVADTGNNRIQVFYGNGTFISQWGGYGQDQTRMRFPSDIAIDPSSGNVYVADTANDRISSFSRSPTSNVTFSSEEGEIYGNDTRIKIQPIYDGLKSPTAIAFLGPNDMLVLQQENKTIMRIVNGQMLDEPVLDLGNTVQNVTCMCDIAILQNDNGTSYAFLYYHLAQVAEDAGRTKLVNRVYRYDISDAKLTDPKLIFEMPTVPGRHQGGKLMVGPDNNIYVSIGEINRYKTQAENVKNGSSPDGSGGILRFTPNGDAVNGGLLGDTPPVDKYYAYGIRNSFGLDYDPFTGNIWMTDNGPAYGDEINLVRPGFNGGWNKMMGMSSFNKAFNLTDLEFFNGIGKYYDPIFDWRETIGVTDLVFVPSDKLGEEYEGNLFVGDFNSGYLYRFILNESRTGLLLNGSLSDGVANNNIEKLEARFAKINGGGITDLEIGPDGLVYIVDLVGKIVRLEPIDTNATSPLIEKTNITNTASVSTNATDTNATVKGETTGAIGATTDASLVPDSTSLTDTA